MVEFFNSLLNDQSLHEIIKRICVGEHTIPEISFELNNYELYADNISKVVNDVITNIELKSYDVIN